MPTRANIPSSLQRQALSPTMNGEQSRTQLMPRGAGAQADTPARPDLDDRLTRNRVEAGLFGEETPAIRLGRFVLLERIGAGGMGEVYAAYDPDLDRKVAIKLVRQDRDLDRAGDRLLREAQTLARLSHPNVVQVHEAGTFADHVYIAMEFVRGTGLDTWLAQHRDSAGWRRVLDMFLAAGRGLAAAHEAGLMHRDFKPSNVLVGDEGRVRVIDFGLARAETTATREPGPDAGLVRTDSSSNAGGAARLLTTAGAFLGTPAYMAPEQLAGKPADRRSDVWSFCVALHEGLHGVRPFTGNNVGELERAITTGEPVTPPGSKVPAWIGRVLGRGLAVQPDERFQSMDELIAALERDPARRQRRMGLAAVLVLAGVAAGSVAMSFVDRDHAAPCAQAGSEMDAIWGPEARERVRIAFAATGVPYGESMARSVATLLDQYAARWRHERMAACRATHVQRTHSADTLELRAFCLDRHARRLDGLLRGFEHADSAVVERALAAVVDLPDIDECRDSEALRLGMRPPANAATRAAVQAIRDRLARGHALEQAGRYDDAARLADAEMAAATRLGDAPVQAEAMFLAGRVRLLRGGEGDEERGRELLIDAVGLAEASRHDALSAEIWNTLASLRVANLTDTRVLGGWNKRALAAVERIGDSGRQRAQALQNMGILAFVEHRHADAERYQTAAIELCRQSGLPALVEATYAGELGNTLAAMGKIDDARQRYERALSIFRSELGTSHPQLARALLNTALFLATSGDNARARVLLDEAGAIWTALGEEHGLDMARVHLVAAQLDHQSGALTAAQAHARRALAIYERRYGSDDPGLLEPLVALGVIHYRARRFDESVTVLRRVLALLERTQDPGNQLYRGIVASNLGEALIQVGRPADALLLLGEAERIMVAMATENPVLLALPRKGRGAALLAMGRAAEAVAPLEEALALFREHPGYSLELADAAWALARALRAAGRDTAGRARELAREAGSIYEGQGEAGMHERAEIAAWLRQAGK